jgi:hypothetical protein
MSVEIVKQFNEILGSFLQQLTSSIDCKYYDKFKMAIRFNSTIAIEKFLVHALPLREKILNRDETYFTTNDYSSMVDNDDDTMNEILNLKDVYNNFDKKSKSNVWDIFQAMLLLGEDYIRDKMRK